MNDRIALLLKAKNISPSQLADELGIQRSGVSHIMTNRNKPGLEFIQKLLKKYPDISYKWILFGEGPMMNPYPEVNVSHGSPEVAEKKLMSSKPLLFELFPDENQEDNANAIENELSDIKNSDKSVDDQLVEEVKSGKFPVDIFVSENPEANMEDEESSKIKPEENLTAKIENVDEMKSGIKIKDPAIQKNNRIIQKIVIFYSDKTFIKYSPASED
ncbi:MAG: helix-turn-helix domain-containing protein [Lentimicrobium sp.]|nr:helix-turn-helix domain-containing protein [Lentimicrobium sp.]